MPLRLGLTATRARGSSSSWWLHASVLGVLFLCAHRCGQSGAPQYISTAVLPVARGGGRWSWDPDSRGRRSQRQPSREPAGHGQASMEEVSVHGRAAGQKRRYRRSNQRSSGALELEDVVRQKPRSSKGPGWLQDLRIVGLQMDSATYGGFVSTALQAGDLDEAVGWLHRAQEDSDWNKELLDISVDEEILHRVLTDAVDQNRTKEVKQHMLQLFQFSRTRDAALIDAVVGAILLDEGFDAAQQWLVNVGLDPREWLPQEGKFTELHKIASVAAVKSWDGNHVADMFRQALKHGVNVELACMKRAIHVAMSVGDFSTAREFFHESNRKGRLRTVEINNMIRTVGKHQGFAEAQLWFKDCLEAGIAPNDRTWRYMMQAAISDDDAEAPARWYNYSLEAGVSPHIVAFNILIHAAGKRGDYEEAERLFAQCLKEGLVPQEYTYAGMITVCLETNDINAAESWFAKAQAAGAVKQTVYQLIVAANMRHARGWRVEELFRQMCKDKVEVSAQLLRTMRFALGRGRLLQLCQELGVDAAMILARDAYFRES